MSQEFGAQPRGAALTPHAVLIVPIAPQEKRNDQVDSARGLYLQSHEHAPRTRLLRHPSQVYNQSTQFEEFPKFIDGVKEVKQVDDKRLHWLAQIGGKEKEWTAKIVEQIPDDRIAWESESGEYTSGLVDFAKLGPDRTRVALEISYDPKGFVENAGDTIGVVSRRVENDLEHFKEFIETRGQETGAWRGTIR